jgi:hypothetical protein
MGIISVVCMCIVHDLVLAINLLELIEADVIRQVQARPCPAPHSKIVVRRVANRTHESEAAF